MFNTEAIMIDLDGIFSEYTALTIDKSIHEIIQYIRHTEFPEDLKGILKLIRGHNDCRNNQLLVVFITKINELYCTEIKEWIKPFDCSGYFLPSKTILEFNLKKYNDFKQYNPQISIREIITYSIPELMQKFNVERAVGLCNQGFDIRVLPYVESKYILSTEYTDFYENIREINK